MSIVRQFTVAVDGAAGRVPAGGVTDIEFRGVVSETGSELFRYGPMDGGTNNAAEFLAIVWALQCCPDALVFSDSAVALGWVKRGRVKDIKRYSGEVLQQVAEAQAWLRANPHAWRLCRKWDTRLRGEIPADFGRKS